MSFDVEAHVVYQIANAPLRTYPFAHLYVENVFPADFYAQLRAALPSQDNYVRLDQTGSVPAGDYKERFVCDPKELGGQLGDPDAALLWQEIDRWMRAYPFAAVLLDRFRAQVGARFGAVATQYRNNLRLVRDFTNYALTPHTDHPSKVISVLFYLPADERWRGFGTSLYIPNDPEFRCAGGVRHPREWFRHMWAAPFVPNSMLAFFKTDQAFHGVEPVAEAGVVRDLLLYNVYAADASGAWPKD